MVNLTDKSKKIDELIIAMVGSSIFFDCQLKIGIASHQGHPYFFAFSFSSVPAAYSACGIRITHGLAPQSTVTDPAHCFTALQFW